MVALRVLQYVLDEMLVVVPLFLLAIGVVWLFHPHGIPALLLFLKIVFYTTLGLAFGCLWALDIWWPHRHGGQTPAMRWLRLRVVTLDGGQPSLWAFAGREVLLVIDGFAWGLVGVTVMLCTRRRQRFGDVVMRTMVVRVPKKRDAEGERARSADEAALPRPDGDLGAVARPQFPLRGRDVRLHRGQ